MNLSTEHPRQNLRAWLPGLLISAIAVWLIYRMVDWKSFGQAIVGMDLLMLAPALICYGVAMLARALAWRVLLQKKVSLWRTVLGMNEGYLMNTLFPFRLGELARAFLIGRATGEGTFFVLSTIVVERAYDMAFAAGLLLGMLPLALAMDWARPAAFVILGLVIMGLVALYFITRQRDRFYDLVLKFGGRWKFINDWALPKLHAVLDGFGVLTNPRLFITSLLFLASSWGIAILECYFIMRGFVPDAQVWWGAFALSVSSLGAALPSAPGSLGVYEASAVGALTLVGCPAASALAYVLVLHLLHLFLSSMLGFVGLAQEGESLSALYSKLRRNPK
jgi:uncharacterized protein (TIRG00374 family)